MAGATGSYKQEIIALASHRDSRLTLPLLACAALGSAGLIFWLLDDSGLAAGFAAAVIGAAGLFAAFRPGVSRTAAPRDLPPDWSVARAAANASGVAVAVTDRNSRLLCASDLYGEWFSGFPAPTSLPLDREGAQRLADAGRDAWRDGEARAEGLTHGALRFDAQVTRAGRADEYLLWHLQPVRQFSLVDEVTRMMASDLGSSLATRA